jgi:hypothetical protein
MLEMTTTSNTRTVTKRVKEFKFKMVGRLSPDPPVFPLVDGTCEFSETGKIPDGIQLTDTRPSSALHREHDLVFKLDMSARHGKPATVSFPVRLVTSFTE